jgi:hypothetical protein
MEKHSGHEKHLCKMIVGDQATVEEIKPLVDDPRYICHFCKRLANKSENLCYPESLRESEKHEHE